MKITIIVEEELTHKVLVGFKNNSTICGLGSSFNVLIDYGVDALAAIYHNPR